jgi:flagellar basal body-associated protein FliL
MARPTKPKDLKPKAEGESGPAAAPAGGGGGGGGGLDLKFIIMLVVVVLASILGSAGSSYLMSTMVVLPEMSKQMAQVKPAEGGEGGEGGSEHGGEAAPNEVGMNLELDEFTVNLKQDPQISGNQYLRAKVSLSVKVPEKENCYIEEKHAAVPHHAAEIATAIPGGKIVGGAAMIPGQYKVDRTLVAEEGKGPSCEDIFKENMAKYVPTVRDIINGALMKRTASQLASLEGQEALKDEIKEQLNTIMGPDYEVLRVNFQDFIIQR